MTSKTAQAASGSPWGALAYPNYRRYWFAAIVRVFGIQFRFIGAGWLVAVELDQSPFWLGVVWLATALPTIVLSVPAGALADRSEPYRLMVLSQVLSFVGHFVLAVLIVTDVVSLWMVVVWAAGTGSFAALSAPSMSALLPRLIEREAMSSAVALNSGVWGAMRVVGPALSGILIALVGTGQAFFVAAATMAISVVVLLTIRLPARTTAPASAAQSGVMVGFRFISSRPLFLAIIGLSFFASVFGSSYVVLLPNLRRRAARGRLDRLRLHGSRGRDRRGRRYLRDPPLRHRVEARRGDARIGPPSLVC